MMHLGDITKISGSTAPPVDCIIGGSPCQDLSVAGKREGLAGERSGLFMEQIRIVKEMRKEDRERGRADHLCRPRFMVWENVPGAFSSRGGADFGAVLEEIVRIVEPEAPAVPVPEKGWPTSGCLVGDGWSVAWRVLDAQFWGVPQRRRRIALVADFGGRAAPEILFERCGLRRDPETGGAERETVAVRAESGVGGTICMATGQAGEEVTHGISPTLNCNHEQPVLCLNDQGGAVMSVSDDVVGTLRAQEHGHQPLAFSFNPRAGAKAHGIAFAEEQAPTLGAELPTPAVTAKSVRRLTPMECERLQGFPDGWTSIGPWTDSKGKLHKESSDSSRYKALGNSIAIPPWKWVLKRLCAHFEQDATMASLFDGIGGFPYIWEQLNGKGSCLWASEIEEFPIAVTKFHFGQEEAVCRET